MKLLTLLLTLATGETDRATIPAWECRSIQASHEQAATVGGHTERDDGVRVVAVECVLPTFHDLITLPSTGDCELTEEA